MASITQSLRITGSSNRFLIFLAGLFLAGYSLALTLSPAARMRSWQVDYRWGHWVGYAAWLFLVLLVDWQLRQKLRERDPYLFPVAALLTGWGLMTIWRLYPDFGMRQTIWFGIAALVFTLGLRLPLNLGFLRRYKYLLLSAGLILTAFTLIFGTNPTGSPGPKLWLGCCGFYFQPSEPLKLLLIIFFSAYLAGKKPWLAHSSASPGSSEPGGNPKAQNQEASSWAILVPLLMMTGIALSLLLVQRDLGTATIFLFLVSVITYLATERKMILLLSIFLLVLAGLGSYYLFDVVQLRIEAWINPWLDPSNRSYQIVQSLIALANGGVGGRGPGMGNPTLVPISHSDFIFSAIIEEGGLLGGIGLIGLLMLLTASGIRIALRASDNFQRYLAAGLTAYLIGQSLLIISGNIRLLPLTGVTLPFVSYGGSSLLTAYLSLLLLALISQSGNVEPGSASNPGIYVYFGSFLLVSLAFASLAIGWWTYYRGPDLLERTDNARRAIADRYIKRGNINDRDNKPIIGTTGEMGEFERDYEYAGLGSLFGFSHPRYGQSGLEATLDPYLRGLQGNSPFLVWWHHLLYGQPPPGLDIRLNLDMKLQQQAADMMSGSSGALVILNAENGEVLTMVSQPSYEPDNIDETWSELVIDPSTPLLNRALQGRYRPGTALGPFILAALSAQESSRLTELDTTATSNFDDSCAIPGAYSNWAEVTAAGCSRPLSELAQDLDQERFSGLLEDLGFFTNYSLAPGNSGEVSPIFVSTPEEVIQNQSDFQISPLQLARAAALLSSGGAIPEPKLVAAINLPTSGWTVFPAPSGKQEVFNEIDVNWIAEGMADENLPFWQVASKTGLDEEQEVSWYLAGTLPSRSGTPLVMVVVLEGENPEEAMLIGREMLDAALQVEK